MEGNIIRRILCFDLYSNLAAFVAAGVTKRVVYNQRSWGILSNYSFVDTCACIVFRLAFRHGGFWQIIFDHGRSIQREITFITVAARPRHHPKDEGGVHG